MDASDQAAEVTGLLLAWSSGDSAALDQLIPAVYAQLRSLANRELARERGGSLQPTSLVHEAYLRLIQQQSVTWHNRAHFFAIAARIMRRVLIDHARRRLSEKRGGDAVHVTLGDAGAVAVHRSAELIALDEALDQLAEMDARKARVVEMRYFAGMTVEETAEALGVSPVTVMRDWSTARAWLHRAIAGVTG
jgi:RNA polymerase sigma-70 factor, ECF subfamily